MLLPYYSYPFANDEPLDIAVNSLGVVFSHSSGNDTLLLALYDDNADGRADRDEVVVEGLSIDNNLFLHGLAVTGLGNVYVIEDASGSEDGSGGNGGTPRIDAFPDPYLNGFLTMARFLLKPTASSISASRAWLLAYRSLIPSSIRPTFLCANSISTSSIANRTQVALHSGPIRLPRAARMRSA